MQGEEKKKGKRQRKCSHGNAHTHTRKKKKKKSIVNKAALVKSYAHVFLKDGTTEHNVTRSKEIRIKKKTEILQFPSQQAVLMSA